MEQASRESGQSDRFERLRRLSAVLVETSEAVMRAANADELLRAACQIAVEQGDLRMAWTGLVDEELGVVRRVSSFGADDGYTDSLGITLRDEPEGRGPVGTAARTARPCWINDVALDERMEPWRVGALEHGFGSVGAFPVLIDGRPRAVLAVYAAEVGFFDEEELRLMCRLASNVAYGWASVERDEQRRKSEAARRGSERLFRHGFDRAAVGLALVDERGLFAQVNPALCRMLGRGSEDLLGSPVSTVTHLGDEDERRWDAQALGSASDLSSHFEERYVRPDGSVVWAIVLRSRVIDPDGRSRYYAQFIDVTVNRRAEQELRRRAAQQATVAALGRRALSAVGLEELFAEAAEMVVDALGVDMSSVFELVGTSEAVLRGGCGLPDTMRPDARIPIGPDTLAGFALRTRQPVIVNDFAKETRFVAEFVNSTMGLASCTPSRSASLTRRTGSSARRPTSRAPSPRTTSTSSRRSPTCWPRRSSAGAPSRKCAAKRCMTR
jgi:PAS domain S-box-containing protein